MDTSTPQGDVEVTNVDSAAQALMARYEQPEVEETETVEVTGEKVIEELEASEEVETEEVAEEDASDEEEAPSFQTVAELAEAVDMPIDEFMAQIKLTTKVNGDESEVTLSDLKKGYQLEADYTRKNQEFVEQRKQFDAHQAQAQTQLNAELQKAGQAFGLAQQQLTHEFNTVDWAKLQAEDPTNYVIQQNEFGKRQAQINLAIEQASTQAQALADKQAEDRATADQSYLQEQDSLLLEAIPSWRDKSTRETEAQALAKYMTDAGFQPDEISQIKDHRYILMARAAMQGSKVATKVDLAKKKVKKVPKLVKPNARQNTNHAQKKSAAALAKAKKSGRVEDFAQALIARN